MANDIPRSVVVSSWHKSGIWRRDPIDYSHPRFCFYFCDLDHVNPMKYTTMEPAPDDNNQNGKSCSCFDTLHEIMDELPHYDVHFAEGVPENFYVETYEGIEDCLEDNARKIGRDSS